MRTLSKMWWLRLIVPSKQMPVLHSVAFGDDDRCGCNTDQRFYHFNWKINRFLTDETLDQFVYIYIYSIWFWMGSSTFILDSNHNNELVSTPLVCLFSHQQIAKLAFEVLSDSYEGNSLCSLWKKNSWCILWDNSYDVENLQQQQSVADFFCRVLFHILKIIYSYTHSTQSIVNTCVWINRYVTLTFWKLFDVIYGRRMDFLFKFVALLMTCSIRKTFKNTYAF